MNTALPITASVPAVRTDLHGGFLALETRLSLGGLTVQIKEHVLLARQVGVPN